MQLVRLALTAYSSAAVKAGQAMLRNWPIIPGAVGLYLISEIVQTLLAPFQMGGAMLAGTIQLILLGLFYHWISSAIGRKRISFAEYLEYDFQRFFELISVAFIFFLIQFPVQLIAGAPGLGLLPFAVHFAIVIFVNPVAEVIMIKRLQSLEALSEAAQFVRANWIEWFLPQLILLLPILVISPLAILTVVALTDPLAPALIFFHAMQMVLRATQLFAFPLGFGLSVGSVLLVVLVIWICLFRVLLYQDLATGNRRQRLYRQSHGR